MDLKADRKNRALLVHGAFAEAGQDPGFVAAELAPELERMAGWLGLERVIVGERGEVAAPLRTHHFAVDEVSAEPPRTTSNGPRPSGRNALRPTGAEGPSQSPLLRRG